MLNILRRLGRLYGLGVAVVGLLLFEPGHLRADVPFSRGDSNCDGRLDLSDAVYTLQWLFTGGGEPCCSDGADTNDDGRVDLSDSVFGLNFLFQGGAPPAIPYPDCGLDPTSDALECASYLPCATGEDSDGNGIPDAVERGPVPQLPSDSDGDLTPDYLDRDDDADGILDINDAERLNTLLPLDPLGPGGLFLFEARTGPAPDRSAHGVARVGDELVLEGIGFTPGPGQNLVLFEGEGAPLNLQPSAASDIEIRVLVPAGARGPVALVSGDRRTGDLPINVLPAGAPLLFSLSDPYAQAGSLLTLRGLGLGQVEEVRFGAIISVPSLKLEDRLEVPVPDGSSTGGVTAVAAGVESNSVLLRVTRPVTARMVLPQGAQTAFASFEVLGSGAGAAPDATGRATVQIEGAGADMLHAFLRPNGVEPPALYFMAVSVPADGEVVLDAMSTAVAMLLEQSSVLLKGDPAAVAAARGAVVGIPAVQDLAAAIGSRLAADPSFLGGPAESLRAPFLAALQASQPQLGEDGGAAGGGAATPGQATFLPDHQYNIFLEQIEGTGNILVRNGTMLFLSAEIRSHASRRLLEQHATSFIDDPHMIGPEAGVLRLTYDSRKEYSQPSYSNARVQVITAGAANPLPATELEKQVHAILWWRTVIERVILPLLSYAANLVPIDNLPGIVLKEIVTQFPDVVKDAAELARQGQVSQALLAILEVFLREIENQGPFFENLLEKLVARGALKGTITPAAFVARAAPALRKLNWALLAIDTLSTGVNVAITIAELLRTGIVLDYDVFFRLEVTAANPLTVDRAPIPQVLQVKGFGFRPLDDGTLPEVIIEDRGKTGSPATSSRDGSKLVTVDEISPDGTLMYVSLEKELATDLEGPLALRVKHGVEEVQAPQLIVVRGELEITRMSPSTGKEGVEITIEGTGFRPEPGATLRVRFQEAQPASPLVPFLVNASVSSVTDSLILATVPALPEEKDSGAWEVYIEQGPVTRRVRSNQKAFYTKKYLPTPSGVIALRAVDDQHWGALFILLPNGRVLGVGRPRPLDGGAIVGTWSGGGGRLTITPCPSEDVTYDFEGSILEGDPPFQVCCEGVGCGWDGAAPRPDWECIAIEGILTRRFPNRPDIEPESRIVNNRFADPPGNRIQARDGYYPLDSSVDWNCGTGCFQVWVPGRGPGGSCGCIQGACD